MKKISILLFFALSLLSCKKENDALNTQNNQYFPPIISNAWENIRGKYKL